MDVKKKQAAAMAAVMIYLKQEEEALAMQAMSAPVFEQISAVHTSPPLKVWGISGRQAQMQMRNMMQMKTFR